MSFRSSRSRRSPAALLAGIAMCAGALTGFGAFGGTPVAHAQAPSPGATGLHDGMRPAGTQDAKVSSGTPGGALAPQVTTAGNQPLGVDVSGHQHPGGASINWQQVAASGHSFAFVKATEYYTDDVLGPVLYQNPYMAQDLQGARAAGLVVGTYDFAHPENSATAQADQFAAAIGTMPAGSLPPVLDLEVNGGLSPSQLVSWAHSYLNRLESDTGTVPMIYASPGFWSGSMGGSTAFTRYPLWEANWTGSQSSPPAVFGGWSTYNVWQWTDAQTVPGISGPVDEDVFNGADPSTLAQRLPTGLNAGGSMHAGDVLVSPDQQYRLSLQSDGNLVEYGNGRALWATNTWGNSGAHLDLQTDGNLVLYSSTDAALWSTRTWGAGSGAHLSLQDDGNLVLYASSGPVWGNGAPGSDALWAGGTLMAGQQLHSASYAYQLLVQRDGNLVLYRGTKATWSSATYSHTGARLTLQTDGNLVVYDANNAPLWSTRTYGSGSANRLLLQNDGNLVLYSGSRAVWATNTR